MDGQPDTSKGTAGETLVGHPSNSFQPRSMHARTSSDGAAYSRYSVPPNLDGYAVLVEQLPQRSLSLSLAVKMRD